LLWKRCRAVKEKEYEERDDRGGGGMRGVFGERGVGGVGERGVGERWGWGRDGGLRRREKQSLPVLRQWALHIGLQGNWLSPRCQRKDQHCWLGMQLLPPKPYIIQQVIGTCMN